MGIVNRLFTRTFSSVLAGVDGVVDGWGVVSSPFGSRSLGAWMMLAFVLVRAGNDAASPKDVGPITHAVGNVENGVGFTNGCWKGVIVT